VFEGLGCISGENKIVISFSLQNDFKEELETMESAEGIKKINQLTQTCPKSGPGVRFHPARSLFRKINNVWPAHRKEKRKC